MTDKEKDLTKDLAEVQEPKANGKVTTLEDLEKLFARVRKAQKEFSTYSQEEVDYIFKKAAMAANAARIPLSIMAVEETGMGDVADKVIKNHFAAEHIYHCYKNEKTCGIIEYNEPYGFYKVAEPVGVVGAVVPTTNPTSTAINKTLICLKTRNGIIFSPHPRAAKCTNEAARIVHDAAVEAGAPEGIIGWIDEPSIEMSQALMENSDLILATGGPGMVKAAYSSGKPALGVGPGNTPVIIDETADLEMAVSSVVVSKTFDNGVICASEQSIIVQEDVYDEVMDLFRARSCYFLSDKEKEVLGPFIIREGGGVNPDIVGQKPHTIAKLAGLEVPEDVKILMAEITDPSASEPFANEKLSPILGVFKYSDFDEALDLASAMIAHGGNGHTSCYYTDETHNKDKIEKMFARMRTGRVLINTPTSQGAIGDLFNFMLPPSLTLGCGSWGGNSVSENVNVKHLLNIKSVAERRDNMLWFKVPEKVYFKYGSLSFALQELAEMGRKRAFIVTDKGLASLGFPEKVTSVLSEAGIETKVFTDVEPDPTLALAKRGALQMEAFEPDIIIGLGGGSAMDAAKIMQVMYEYPDVDFEDLALRFSDIRKRVYGFPKLGVKALLVCIATTAGTGSEVTPFTIITDQDTHVKYALADYELTPYMAISDPELMMGLPKMTTAISGIDALTHALEAYVSTMASPYTDGLALEAGRLIFEYLPRCHTDGKKDREAREQLSNAATIAGMAFANAFLGICHSCAHKLGAHHHVPHGMANSMLIEEVIRFNAVRDPRRQAAFSQYRYPDSVERYAKYAEHLGFGGKTEEESVENLIKEINKLKTFLEIPANMREFGADEKTYFDSIDTMAYEAFDDQCTGTNPRYPSIDELKEIYKKIW